MSEDVSAQIRTGVTIIVVASLVAVLLNLMVIAQSIVSTGMGTLQSGVDSVMLQEYEQFNQKNMSGTQVKSALSLYSSRDVGILIATKMSQDSSPAVYFNYGTLLKKDGTSGSTTAVNHTEAGDVTMKMGADVLKGTKKSGESFYTMEYDIDQYQCIKTCYNTKHTVVTSDIEYVLESARFRAELVKNKSGNIVGIVFTQLT